MKNKYGISNSFIRLILIAGLIFPGFLCSAQDCDPKQLAEIPGLWKGPGKGSIENVSQANLIKEREVLAKIHEMVKKSYSPIGGELSYSYVFGYNKYTGKNWISDPYEYVMRFLEFLCIHNAKSPPYYEPNAETGTSVNFSINKIWSHNGRFNLSAAELADDHYDGYLTIKEWPVKKEGFYYWLLLEEEERYPEREYQFLITYDNKLPFKPYTKGEYLQLKIPQLKERYEESLEYLKSTDPDFDAQSKRIYEDLKEIIKEEKLLLESTIELQKSFSPEEASMPAIIDAGESKGEFRGFKTEHDQNIRFLVKPDPYYYDPTLPKWVPQFICINVMVITRMDVHKDNVAAIEKAIDFKYLKSLLAKEE